MTRRGNWGGSHGWGKPVMAAERTRAFEDSDRDAAINAATKWIFELSRRASLYVKSILAVERDGKWVATVTFSEATN
jgi:predicted nucleic acid-binding Zn ribbon protein